MTKKKPNRRGPLAPDPEIWSALDDGRGLRRVLEDFYARVFADEKLAPFFANANIEWVIDKQFAFLCSIFTGEDCYFGLRPRNAHHWMVISDELFDHRERLMEECLRRYGMSDHLIARFRAVDEVYRRQIVKGSPRPLVLNGIRRAADGYGTMTVDVGTICDECRSCVEPGARVIYHLRTGYTYCEPCGTTITAGELATTY